MKNKYCIFIGIIVILFVPFVINYLVTRNRLWEYSIAGEPKDWMNFWVSYISSLASLAMVFITWLTLKQMRSQWESEKNPHIVLSIGIAQKCCFLKIYNVGILPAYNVKLFINDSFVQLLPNNEAKDCINAMKIPFFIDGRSTKYVLIGAGTDLEKAFKNKDIELVIYGNYCNDKPIEPFKCNVKELVGKKFARITDDLTHAVEGLEKSVSSARSDTNYMTLQKSLDSIAKSLEQIKNDIKVS